MALREKKTLIIYNNNWVTIGNNEIDLALITAFFRYTIFFLLLVQKHNTRVKILNKVWFLNIYSYHFSIKIIIYNFKMTKSSEPKVF